MTHTQYWWIMASFPASGTRTPCFPCGAPGCHFHWRESVWRRHRIALMVQQYAVIKSSFWSTHISKNYFKWHLYYDWFYNSKDSSSISSSSLRSSYYLSVSISCHFVFIQCSRIFIHLGCHVELLKSWRHSQGLSTTQEHTVVTPPIIWLGFYTFLKFL